MRSQAIIQANLKKAKEKKTREDKVRAKLEKDIRAKFAKIKKWQQEVKTQAKKGTLMPQTCILNATTKDIETYLKNPQHVVLMKVGDTTRTYCGTLNDLGQLFTPSHTYYECDRYGGLLDSMFIHVPVLDVLVPENDFINALSSQSKLMVFIDSGRTARNVVSGKDASKSLKQACAKHINREIYSLTGY